MKCLVVSINPTYIQAGMQPDRQTDRHAARQPGTQTDRHTDKQADRGMGRQTDREKDRHAYMPAMDVREENACICKGSSIRGRLASLPVA